MTKRPPTIKPEPRLVSVVTPTWKRSETLRQRAIPSLQAQTYSRIEHILVSDGPDDELLAMMIQRYPYGHYRRDSFRTIPVEVVNLGRNSSSMLPDSFGIMPNLVGTWVARGDYITWMADDDLMHPKFVETCVAMLDDDPEVGFVYTSHRHRSAQQVYDVACTPPRHGGVATVMFRAELLAISNWQLGDGINADWKLIQRWLDADVKWAYDDAVLFEHFANH